MCKLSFSFSLKITILNGLVSRGKHDMHFLGPKCPHFSCYFFSYGDQTVKDRDFLDKLQFRLHIYDDYKNAKNI